MELELHGVEDIGRNMMAADPGLVAEPTDGVALSADSVAGTPASGFARVVARGLALVSAIGFAC